MVVLHIQLVGGRVPAASEVTHVRGQIRVVGPRPKVGLDGLRKLGVRSGRALSPCVHLLAYGRQPRAEVGDRLRGGADEALGGTPCSCLDDQLQLLALDAFRLRTDEDPKHELCHVQLAQISPPRGRSRRHPQAKAETQPRRST